MRGYTILVGLLLGAMALGGCGASNARMDSAERRIGGLERSVDRVSERSNEQGKRIETLDQRIYEIARDCCGKQKSDCKCSSRTLCATVKVHDPGSSSAARSGGDCELTFPGRVSHHNFEDTLEVTVRREVTGKHYFIDPKTGEKCYLSEAKSWREGETVRIVIGSDVTVQTVTSIRAVP